MSTVEEAGICAVTSVIPAWEGHRILMTRANDLILVSDHIVSGDCDTWAWHHRAELAEGILRISADNRQVVYRLTGERGLDKYDDEGQESWFAVKIRDSESVAEHVTQALGEAQ